VAQCAIGLGGAVLVEVTPNAQVAKLGIAAVDFAVAVAVQVAQGIKAIHSSLAVAFDEGIAEQFAAIVDGAVAVLIQDQEAVVGTIFALSSSGIFSFTKAVRRNNQRALRRIVRAALFKFI